NWGCSMSVEMVKTSGLSAPFGMYSHVSRATGTMIFIAGQVGANPQGEIVGKGDFAVQMRQVFANLSAALKSAGASFADVVKFTTYLTSAADIPKFMATRNELYAGIFPHGNYPPNTLLVISRLVEPELLLEIEAIAMTNG
ncbi:MAG: RidA family protein, partial [Vulcanimicrobiaceae bacterium]